MNYRLTEGRNAIEKTVWFVVEVETERFDINDKPYQSWEQIWSSGKYSAKNTLGTNAIRKLAQKKLAAIRVRTHYDTFEVIDP